MALKIREQPIRDYAMFNDQIGKMIEVYVDDMLVKSKVAGDHMGHLGQMFAILRKY